VIAGIAVAAFGVTIAMIRGRTVAPRPAVDADTSDDRMVDAVRRPEVARVLAVFVVLNAAITACVSALPLLVTQRLGLDLVWAGAALGTAAALEIPVLLLLGRHSVRVGQRRLVAAGCVAGIAYYAAMTLVGGPVALLGLQVLSAVFVACASGVGLTLVQDVVGRPGLASALFMNTTRVGAILAGPVVALAGVGSGTLGYAAAFAGCAVLVAAGLALLVQGYARSAISRSRAT
jgi:SET family sugar efflux transporter-like MFS transporter